MELQFQIAKDENESKMLELRNELQILKTEMPSVNPSANKDLTVIHNTNKELRNDSNKEEPLPVKKLTELSEVELSIEIEEMKNEKQEQHNFIDRTKAEQVELSKDKLETQVLEHIVKEKINENIKEKIKEKKHPNKNIQLSKRKEQIQKMQIEMETIKLEKQQSLDESKKENQDLQTQLQLLKTQFESSERLTENTIVMMNNEKEELENEARRLRNALEEEKVAKQELMRLVPLEDTSNEVSDSQSHRKKKRNKNKIILRKREELHLMKRQHEIQKAELEKLQQHLERIQNDTPEIGSFIEVP